MRALGSAVPVDRKTKTILLTVQGREGERKRIGSKWQFPYVTGGLGEDLQL